MSPQLRTLPEQLESYPENPRTWFISQEFRRVIDSLPYYAGVLRETGDNVRLGFLESQGFEPEVPMRAYFMGEIYAVLFEKARPLRLPFARAKEVLDARKDYLRDVFGEITGIEFNLYDCSSDELFRALKIADEGK